MKKLLILALLVITASCASTNFSGSADLMSGVIENNKSKDENFIIANEFMVEHFNNAKSVIQFSDKEAGVVKGKYFMGSYNVVQSGFYVGILVEITPIITIRVKENALKIEIDGRNVRLGYTKGLGGFTETQYKTRATKLIEALKATAIIDNRENW